MDTHNIPASSFLTDSDPVAVRLNCYEPNSQVISMTESQLCRHTMLLGATGCGKTTIMRGMVRDLIHHQSSDKKMRPALLIFDFKSDATPQLVQKWCREAGREADFRWLRSGGPWRYDLLASLGNHGDIETQVAKFALAGTDSNRENQFWESSRRTQLQAALTLAALIVGTMSGENFLGFLHDWLVGGGGVHADAIDRLVTQFREAIRREPDTAISLHMRMVVGAVENWRQLDARTKGIMRAMFSNTLSAMMSPSFLGYLGDGSAPDGGLIDLDTVCEEGLVLVVTSNALQQPESTRLLAMLLKCDFYGALMRRQERQDELSRLAVMVADEYPLVATGSDPRFGDVSALATLRSRRGAIIAGSQGFSGLDLTLGKAVREAAFLNINNWLFLQSHEASVDEFAERMMGFISHQGRDITPENGRPEVATTIGVQDLAWRFDPICPFGSLAKLEPHQAYIATSDGRRSRQACWLVPNFEVPSGPVRQSQERPLLWGIMEKLREQPELPDNI